MVQHIGDNMSQRNRRKQQSYIAQRREYRVFLDKFEREFWIWYTQHTVMEPIFSSRKDIIQQIFALRKDTKR